MCKIILFLSLARKKKYQKERARAQSTVLLRHCGSNSLRSNNRPLPAPDSASADAPTPMPEGCAVQAAAL
ncbi:MAG: hypothetical protein BHV75_05095 [Bacteroides oleiciplenus]|nr:MAG: hypothetical protein BHV75_05095 [Bacteroides oleiciplenus]